MSAANFNQINSSIFYVVKLKEDYDVVPELKQCLINSFEELKKKRKLSEVYDEEGMEGYKYLYDVDGYLLLSIEGKEKKYKIGTFTVLAEILLLPGYYSDATLDYRFKMSGDATEGDIDHFLNVVEDGFYGGETREGAERYARWLENWIDKERDRLSELIENVFRQYTTPYVISARFSNGEVWYKKEE